MSVDPFDSGPSLQERIKRAIHERDDGDGADVEAVLQDAVEGTEYTVAGAEDTFNGMVRRGEVYCPADDRVRVTP